MVAPLCSSPLAVLVLAGLFVLLHVTESKPGLPAPPMPAKPPRPRGPAPTRFAGLTPRPPGALWERETVPAPPAPVPPAPLPPTHRRPRTVDTARPLWPHTDGDARGGRGRNNLRAHGHPRGGPWRQCQGTACDGSLPEHHGPLWQGKHAAGARLVHVLAGRAEGLGMGATARGFAVDPNPVLQWLGEGAEQLHAFTSACLCEVHVPQGQRDAWSAVRSAVKAEQMGTEEAIQRRSRSPQGVWTASAPQSPRLLAIAVGARTQAMAQRLIPQVVQVLAPGGVPLFLTDGLKA
jgi:hypothetical protein